MPDDKRENVRVDFDRHSAAYRTDFEAITDDLHARCPVAWTDFHGGYWIASGHREVFELTRSAEYVSSDNDLKGERKGYHGIQIPHVPEMTVRSGFLEMDPPEQRHYRQALNPYLSPAAIARWKPLIAELTRACLDEKIESGEIDFVEDLANIVPAVLTMGLFGLPLTDWVVHCEPAHALVYTKRDSPDFPRVMAKDREAHRQLAAALADVRAHPRPGLIDALAHATVNGATPPDEDIVGTLVLLIAGGFDTTTALTAHALEWLSGHPSERARLSAHRDTLLAPATEEFLRFYAPAPGNGRTITTDCALAGQEFQEGDRLWLSWAMANRDPAVFPDPHTIHLDRTENPHTSFGLGIHRCIGSHVARATFKVMLTQVLDRMPDYACDPDGAVHYDTTGIINGMKSLPATFTPGQRLGPGLEETLWEARRVIDENHLAEPVGRRARPAS